MKFLIYRISIILFFFLIQSCKKDWLDKKSNKNISTPSTLQDLELLLDNNTVMNAFNPALGEVASDGHLINEQFWESLYNYEKTAYTWTYTGPHLTVFDWNYAYQVIFYCNVILEELNKIEPSNPLEKNKWDNIRGNALFHRAFQFFQLAQIYAPPYSATNSQSDLGIPLRLSSDLNTKTFRSTVKQTYDQIIGDLEIAFNLLPNHPLYRTRASKPAVLALFARIYMSMEEYDKANQSANAGLQIYDLLKDYNDLDSNDEYPLGLFNSEVLFHSSIYYSVALETSSVLNIDTALYNLYADDDLRKTLFFTLNSGNILFRGMYNNIFLHFSGLATDELYLIRAECNARKGNKDLAMTDLNNLLRKRWTKNVSFPLFTAIDSEDALRQILTERRKELLLRGIRWSDIRRLRNDPKFAVTLNRKVQGQSYSLLPNNIHKYTLPIPDDVMEFTQIQQNPSW